MDLVFLVRKFLVALGIIGDTRLLFPCQVAKYWLGQDGQDDQ